jgi:hypothetical protein
MDREPFIETYFKVVVGVLAVILAVWCVGVAAIGIFYLFLLASGREGVEPLALAMPPIMLAIGGFALFGLVKLRKALERHGAIYPPE